jgi:sigma-B regulation protein RsbU (phosphoserine phosphatase)
VLASGDRLLFYTDGLTERFSPEGDIFDDNELNVILATHRESEPQQLIETIRQRVDDFAGHQAAEDDQLILLAAIS